MWDNKTFIQFLKEQGHGDKWHTLIYPTMKKCLISKFHFDFLEYRKGEFDYRFP